MNFTDACGHGTGLVPWAFCRGMCHPPGRSTNSMDYLSTPSVAAYFHARECEAYYEALKRAEPRRDFHERLIAALERLIDLTNAPSGAGAVDDVISESLRVERRGRGALGATALEIARTRYPEGIELLRLSEPLTYESLRSAYRSAALRNHPDAGGSHDAMVRVNEAFHFVHILWKGTERGSGCGGGRKRKSSGERGARLRCLSL